MAQESESATAADVEAGTLAAGSDPGPKEMRHDPQPAKDDGLHQGTYDLTINNLTYKVMKKTKKVTEEKILLNSVSAKARHGQILAVMGPSGAGKSTFLDAIAGRIDFNSLEGEILVNGKEMQPSFRRLSGYVMQDDALFPLLTVTETLMISARLRLPGTMSHEEKVQRVNTLIEELGLSSCKDTAIGDEETRGVSGGERRRVSIGVDLIHNPPVLFLDEPTSGLDSTSALNVIQNLHDITQKKQRTVVLTIHQPSFRICEQLDSLLLLGRGNVIYHGPFGGLSQHFTNFGRPPPEHVNSVEYALDLLEAEQSTKQGLQPLIDFMKEKEARNLSQTSGLRMGASALGQSQTVEFSTSFLNELLVLSVRNFKNISRTKELFGARIGLFVMTGAIMGTLFFNAELSPRGLQKRQSYFAFVLALIFFTSTEALPIFLKERQIFIRETSRGAYRSSSYVLSNFLVFLPFFFFLALIQACVGYFLVNLVNTAGSFFFYVLVLFLALVVANSYVIFLSALVPNFITGNTIVTASTAFFFLFSGFFLPRNNIPKYWIWFHYISSFKYPIELLLWNEYTHLPKDTCFQRNPSNNTCELTPDKVLVSLSAGAVHPWANVLIMLLFTFAYRVFLYFALRRQSKAVRK